ncbi:MAG: exodeoxyribonuclease VII small subunit [Nannocystaceae bacterium]|nr:exodeoxyribonuclease VII small subunit [Nannocystaceae bacterium]
MARTPERRATPAAPASARGDDGNAAATDEPGIDAILDQLEGVVRELEGGELPLEQALERFELGVGLARRGNVLLDRVEQRVEMLLADRDETAPLAARGDDEE